MTSSDVTRTAPSGELAELARALGVATEYWDWQGRHVMVSAETIVAVLDALGVRAHTHDEIEAARQDTELAPWRRTLPRCVIARQGRATRIPVHVPHGAPVVLWVELEDRRGRRGVGQVEHNVAPRDVDHVLTGEAMFEIPAGFPLGWHVLNASVAEGEPIQVPLVVVPDRLELPPSVDAHGAFGLMTQMYAMRSRASWGIGDLGDLADLAVWGAQDLGANFVLINPVHAAEPIAPMEPSPYLPTSRRFVNPIYIRVEEVPEVAYLPPEQRAQVEEYGRAARALTDADTIDRDAAWELKRAALRLVYDCPHPPRRLLAFEQFCEREGQGLLDYATWCALVEEYGPHVGAWPVGLHNAQAEGVAAERERLAERVRFHLWLQWVVDVQLAEVQRQARTAGMSVGVMQDLAVGVHPTGADVWGLGNVLAHGVTVGAPPDAYNQRGQDWSQPPWHPDRLADVGYAPFRAMIRAALRHSGGLRIDHVIGLFRLWWVPAGSSPAEGTYVRFDHEALIGILALEAHRDGAVLVGEDLGTVEPWVRDYLRERGILGTSILWFEREEDGSPKRPEDYRRLCLASVTTHDLPPTAGYLAGEHIDLRADLGLFTRPVEVERAEDEADRARVVGALVERGLLDSDHGVAKVVEALHRYLSWTPSLLIGVSVSDLVGDVRTINQPGTHNEYPNWRVPMAGPDRRPVLMEDLMTARSARKITRAVHRG